MNADGSDPTNLSNNPAFDLFPNWLHEDRWMSDLHIRDARKDDREAILAVTLAAYAEYTAGMNSLWEEYRADILMTLVDVGPADQLVAERDGVVVGSVLLYPAGTTFFSPTGITVRLVWPEVRLLAVAPAARGQGVGKTLMDECVRRARQAGARTLALHTTDMMVAAIQMVERMGFVRAPELDFRPADDFLVKGYRLGLAD